MFAVSTFATVRVIEVNKSDKPADSTVTFQFLDGDVGDSGPGVVLTATFSPPVHTKNSIQRSSATCNTLTFRSPRPQFHLLESR